MSFGVSSMRAGTYTKIGKHYTPKYQCRSHPDCHVWIRGFPINDGKQYEAQPSGEHEEGEEITSYSDGGGLPGWCRTQILFALFDLGNEPKAVFNALRFWCSH